MYVDVHCHLSDFKNKDIDKFLQSGIEIVAVSDDIDTSLKTLELSKKYEKIIPCIGIHPWNIKDANIKDIFRINKIISKEDIRCLGEIGLDRRFIPEIWDLQLKFFKGFLEIAKEYDVVMNIHSPKASRDVYELLLKYDINKAIFHWYNGPIELIDKLQENDFLISINPAIQIQKKHRKIVEYTNIKNIVTESDGPYKYRSLFLNPLLIPEVVDQISQIKNMNRKIVREKIWQNYKNIFR